MKLFILVKLSLLMSMSLLAQAPVSQIEGFLEVYMPFDKSVYIGMNAGKNVMQDTLLANTFVGSRSGESTIRGDVNSFVGFDSGKNNTYGSGNVFFGFAAGESNDIGGSNTYLGASSGRRNSSGFGNTYIGSDAGSSSSGNNNVFLGRSAGFSSKGDHKLYVSNRRVDSLEALIYGEFDNEILRVNGDLQIASNNPDGNSRLRMKGTGGVLNEVIRYDSNNNNALIGSVSGGGGQLLFRSDSRTQMALIENGNLGIGVLQPKQKLHVDGTIRLDAVPTSAGSFDLRMNSSGDITKQTSDARLKKNITTLERSLEKLLSLRGVSFTWDEDPKAGVQLGLVAQEVLEVIPEIVHENFDGFYSVDYSELVGVFVEAIKEQQDLITSLKTQNTSLEERVLLLEKQFQALTH